MIHSGRPAEKIYLTCDYLECIETLEVNAPAFEEACEALSGKAWSHEWAGGDPSDLIEDLAKNVEDRCEMLVVESPGSCLR